MSDVSWYLVRRQGPNSGREMVGVGLVEWWEEPWGSFDGWGAACPFCRDWSWTCSPYRLLKFYLSAISNLDSGFVDISNFCFFQLLSNFLSPIFGSDRWPLKRSFPMFLGQLLKREVSLFDSQCVWIAVLNKTWNQSCSACQRDWMFDWQRTDKHKKTYSC